MNFADISKILGRTNNYSNYIKTKQEAELKVIGGQELVDFYNNNNINFDTLKHMVLKGYTIECIRYKFLNQ